MSILDRLNLLIRSELNEVARGDRFRSAIKDMEGSLRDARRQQIEARGNEKRLVAQIRDLRQQAERWEERAVLALKAGDEELAREALIQKNKILTEGDRLRDQLDEQRAYLRDIENALQALEVKLDGARGKMETSRPHSTTKPSRPIDNEDAWDAELRRRMQDRGTDSSFEPIGDSAAEPKERFGTERSFSEFDRMTSKINEIEAETEAYRELNDDDWIDPRRRELEGIFSKMEKKKKTDDDLSDLKKKFSE